MCGIAVFIGKNKLKNKDGELVKRILKMQHSRGPDNTGIQIFDNCIVGHNRLSVIDTNAKSNQPMKDNSSDTWITFNGEIFNYQSLKEKLEKKGHIFSTKSDTEVLLKLYLEYGDEMVRHINGQFAFVIYDVRNSKFFVVRDRLGIIPLYYYKKNDIFLIASSFKALAKNIKFKINEASLVEYLLLRCVLAPQTICEDIYQLEPGHCLIIKDGVAQKKEYWKLSANCAVETFDSSKKRLRTLLREATRKRLRSDVPVGLFLSGGLDSSIICKLATKRVKKLKTYSIRFSEFSDDENSFSKYMAEVCDTDHSIYEVENNRLGQFVDEWINSIDHPNGARDMFAVYLLSKYVKKNNPEVKVVLTGTGSDEIFSGYMNSYFGPSDDKNVDIKKIVRDFVINYGFTDKKSFAKLKGLLKLDLDYSKTLKKVQDCVQGYMSGSKKIDRLNLHNFLYVTVHLAGWELPVADNMAMAFSLETRTPFLDHKFVEFAFSLKGSYKYREGQEKFILREAFKTILPNKIYKREKGPFSRQVMGFLTSNYLNTVSNNDFKILDKYIDLKKINKLHLSEDGDLIWRLLVLARWLGKLQISS